MSASPRGRGPLYDERTGLASTALFRDRVEHALASSLRRPDRVALLLLEIDDQVRVNAAFATTLAGMLRPEDTVAVLEGNYVGVLVEQVAGAAVAQGIRRRLEKVMPCRGSALALSDARGRIGYWLDSSASRGLEV